MKIAVSAESEGLDGKVDEQFGRCRYFLVVELKDGQVISSRTLKNDGGDSSHGAGLRAAEIVAEAGVEAVITGRVGPKAEDALKRLGIKTFTASGPIKDAITRFVSCQPEDSGPETVSVQVNDRARIFFPLLEDNGLDSAISEHFGHAPFFGVYTTETEDLEIIPNTLDHADPNKSPIDQIEESVHPSVIFAKGIGARAKAIIQEKGMSLKTGDFATVREAVEGIGRFREQEEDCGHDHDHPHGH